jgi:N-ethylmaleimide reductase
MSTAAISGNGAQPTGRITLLGPARLGRYELPTRVIMAPMTRMRARFDGVPSEMMATYYAQRATAALIISEATAVSPRGVGYLNTPGLYTEEQAAAWQKITAGVHHKGGRVFVQLFHAGRISHPLLQPGRALPVAPSEVRPQGSVRTAEGPLPFETPRALRREEIASVVAEFSRAAEFAVAAGFDGAEIHAANGYLLDQFLRDGANRRTDEYGGSPANRARLLVEVASAVAAVMGADRTGVRLSPLHGFNDMSDSAPEVTFGAAAAALNDLGLAYLHVVEKDDAPVAGPHFDMGALRRLWKSAYMVNESYDRRRAEAAIAGGADFVSFGKLFIANPDLPLRFETDAPLNSPDRQSFYGGDERGYIDYPALAGRSPGSSE